MEVVDYLKGKDYLEKREEKLFELLDKLDEESFKLFSEIVDLDMNSFYKVDNLFMRINNLSDMYEKLVDCFEYLKNIELESFVYAGKRLQLKRLLIAIVTIYACLNNALIGIGGYIVLSNMANKSFGEENGDITLRVDKYSKYDLQKISRTLINCANILKGKMDRLYSQEELDGLDEHIIFANNTIASYLDGEIGLEEVKLLSEEDKESILRILQKDLNSEETSIYKLLSLLKTKSNNEIKLTKELN
jgi:hypothetical protein